VELVKRVECVTWASCGTKSATASRAYSANLAIFTLCDEQISLATLSDESAPYDTSELDSACDGSDSVVGRIWRVWERLRGRWLFAAGAWQMAVRSGCVADGCSQRVRGRCERPMHATRRHDKIVRRRL
jgi:hypothetical protein